MKPRHIEGTLYTIKIQDNILTIVNSNQETVANKPFFGDVIEWCNQLTKYYYKYIVNESNETQTFKVLLYTNEHPHKLGIYMDFPSSVSIGLLTEDDEVLDKTVLPMGSPITELVDTLEKYDRKGAL